MFSFIFRGNQKGLESFVLDENPVTLFFDNVSEIIKAVEFYPVEARLWRIIYAFLRSRVFCGNL